MTIEDKLADAVFDLIEAHLLRKQALLKSDVRQVVAGVMAGAEPNRPARGHVDIRDCGIVTCGDSVVEKHHRELVGQWYAMATTGRLACDVARTAPKTGRALLMGLED